MGLKTLLGEGMGKKNRRGEIEEKDYPATTRL